MEKPRCDQRFRQELIRIAAHDFKNPLTSLKTLAQMFRRSVERGTIMNEPERTLRNCERMLEQTDKLSLMADVFMVLATYPSEDQVTLNCQTEDLVAIFHELLPQFGDHIALVGIPREPILGHWDAKKLAEAFSFLLSESESVQITIASGEAIVRILFEGDFKATLNESSPRLFLAREIIRAHGGELRGRYEILLSRKQLAAAG